jgi:hypothetical protein
LILFSFLETSEIKMLSTKLILGLLASFLVGSAISAPTPDPVAVESSDLGEKIYCGPGANTGYCGSKEKE